MKKRLGKLIVLSGPSGVGKDTIIKKLLKVNDKLKVSISATTRPPRIGEVDGESYFFVTEKKFKEMIEKKQILEYAKYCGNYYGTPCEAVENALNDGYNVILEIEIVGFEQIKKVNPEIVGIFILPPSIDELKKRIIERNLDDIHDINKRLAEAENEIKYSKNYDFVVTNDNIDDCVSKINEIISNDSEKIKNKTEVNMNLNLLSVDEMLNDRLNKFPLVIAVSKRAREIVDIANENNDVMEEKSVNLAIDEFRDGKYVIYSN